MGELVETGLGWYLDEDYLLTVGNQQLCTIATGGGGAPLSPNTQYTDTDLPRTNVFVIGSGGNPVWIEISNVTSRVYWMFIEMGSYYSGDTIWAVAAVSKEPFSMSMAGWENNPYPATKPPSSPAQRYIETLRGFSLWTDVYGIVIGYHGSASSGGYWFEPNSWSGDIPKLFHESVSGATVVDTGLGWYADPLYLMQYAGVTATATLPSIPQTRQFYKAYDGFCLAAEIEASGFKGPCIISTVEQNATGYATPDWTPPAISGSATYLGLTWYCYRGPWIVPDAGTLSSGLQRLTPVDNSVSTLVAAIVDAAAVTTTAPSSGSKVVTKVQGGAGAFSVVSYPHNENTVHVAVGISSIGNPNSAATVAVDGVNGSYNTFNREGMQFTMFYTEQLIGTLTSNVPVVTLDTDISGLPGVYEPRLFLAAANAAQIHVGYIPADEDPYAPGGTSGPGGGTDTDFDITGDTILDSPLPTFSFANSGFARIYNPNLSQLQRLANYLWTDTTFLQTIINHAKQLLEDPIESIITLNRLPISVPNGEDEVVKVLYIPTNTSMPPVTNQFVDVDCGTLQIKHEYDSALDYNPYTDISLVLPFIGVVQLDPDEVMDKTLSLTYRVDVVSGMCVAKVAVDGCVLYQYSGNCAISMPFNSADFSNYISAMVTAAKSIAGVAAAGAAGAMAAAAEGTNAVKAIVAKATSGAPKSAGASLPKPSNKSTNIIKETFGEGGLGEGTLKAAKKGVANTVSAVVSSKRTIEHAGHFSGNSGFLGVRRPYAIIKRPRMCNPNEYGRFNGRPCMMYLYLGNLSGYTEVQEIHLTGIVATNDELIEIENLLKSGVIL